MSVLNWGRLRDQCLVGLSVIAFFWVASQVVGRVLHIVVVVLLALGLLAVGILIIGPRRSSRARPWRSGSPATSTS